MTTASQLQFTPISEIPDIVSTLRCSFFSQKTLPIEWRKRQLRKLYWGIEDNAERILSALKSDLAKPTSEGWSEIMLCTGEILKMLNNLDEWAKDDYGDVELVIGFKRPVLRKDPLGVVLVIGAFNFPLQVLLAPLIGAIGAGNTALIKPSEKSPATAVVVTQIVEKYLDNSCVKVVNGGANETTAVLNEQFDKICYTGGGQVGRIVATAAAKHLTPCILELGGINPVIVTKNADVKHAAKSIAWARSLNSGQVCAAPGYVLCHPDVEAEFITEFTKSLKTLFPNGYGDMARMNSLGAFHRVRNLLNDTHGKILVGGSTNEAERFIETTLVKVESPTDPVLREEAFGPILALLTVEDLDKAIVTIRTICATPLACYIFTNDKEEQKKLLAGTQSGGVTINDVLMHVACKSAPFGGVGESGYGAYQGKASFDAFVHRRTVVVQASWMEKLLAMRYPPYTPKKLEKLKARSVSKPNFDRDGNVKTAWVRLILRLGSRSIKGALLRWAATLALSYYYLFVSRKAF